MAEGKAILQKVTDFLKKYKFVILILLIGLVLLILPSGDKKAASDTTVKEDSSEAETDYALQIEQCLEEILSKIKGAGKVDVMLTLQRGSYTQYQTDVQTDCAQNESGTQSGEDKKTVILSEGSAYDSLAVSTVEYPLFRGALVVCSGADSAAVRLELIQAVSALTGLSSDHITVVKMN